MTGLTGSGLVLQNNAGDDINVNVNDGTFAFPTLATTGTDYAVTVKTNPQTPWQTWRRRQRYGQGRERRRLVGRGDVHDRQVYRRRLDLRARRQRGWCSS